MPSSLAMCSMRSGLSSWSVIARRHGNPVGGTTELRQVTEAIALGTRQQAVDDFARNQRLHDRASAWRVDQPDQAHDGVEQVRLRAGSRRSPWR